jgi:hypothetical protein
MLVRCERATIALEPIGWQVTEAENGQVAVESLPGRLTTARQQAACLSEKPLDTLCFVLSYNPIQLSNIGGNLLNVLVGYVPLLT